MERYLAALGDQRGRVRGLPVPLAFCLSALFAARERQIPLRVRVIQPEFQGKYQPGGPDVRRHREYEFEEDLGP